LPSLFRAEQKVDIGINLASGNSKPHKLNADDGWFWAVFQNSKQTKHAEIERKYNNNKEE
jgi:hypothetical protein